jgi:hypothetical protein
MEHLRPLALEGRRDEPALFRSLQCSRTPCGP